jgi:uncharacterized protein (TIGR02118 family)
MGHPCHGWDFMYGPPPAVWVGSYVWDMSNFCSGFEPSDPCRVFPSMIRVMVIVSVLYPRHSESRFDHDYYLRTHVPLVESRWGGMGLVKAKLLRGDSTLDGGTPGFEVIALLTFTSMEALKAALASFGSEIIGDISNYTNVQPLIQVNQVLGD